MHRLGARSLQLTTTHKLDPWPVNGPGSEGRNSFIGSALGNARSSNVVVCFEEPCIYLMSAWGQVRSWRTLPSGVGCPR
jgi:hypothetical protein